MNTIHELLLKQIMPLSHEDFEIQSGRKIDAIKPGITIKGHQNNSWLLSCYFL